MSDAVANAATARSLDTADISSMDKSLKTLTLANAALVKEVDFLRAELSANSSSHRSNPIPDSRFSNTG